MAPDRFTLRPRSRTHFPHLIWAIPVATLVFFVAGLQRQPWGGVAGLVVLLLGLRPNRVRPFAEIDLDAEQVLAHSGGRLRRKTRRFPLHQFRRVRLSRSSIFGDVEVDGPVVLHYLSMPPDEALAAARALARVLRATLVLPDGTEEPFDPRLPAVATTVRWPLLGRKRT